jgi:threonine/homoserine/homoserine lactone efflux protein
MDQIWLIISGFAIGIFVAAPIGPVNLICIRRTLAYGLINGFVSGLGAAIGDGVFAAITAFGLTAITLLIEGYSCTLQLVGGLLLLGFGVHTFLAEPVTVAVANVEGVAGGRRNFIGAFLSTFALTITNPATLLGFAALMAGLGTLGDSGQKSYAEATLIVVAVTRDPLHGGWLLPPSRAFSIDSSVPRR